MLIAVAGLTVAALVASPLLARPLVSAPSPIVADVTIAAKVSPALVTRILDEASAIWRKAGFAILWQRTDPAQVVRSSPAAAYVPARLRVIIGDQRGVRRDSGVPLGWVIFDDTNTPGPEIYLSNANALKLLAEAVRPLGAIERMPRAEQETLLGRALGRALAHELGHYLLSSKHHTERGLMQAKLMSPELFSPSRERFTVDVAQHDLIAARLTPPLLVGQSANP